MDIEEFNNSRFGAKDKVIYKKDGKTYNFASVDFEEQLIGLMKMDDSDFYAETIWVRCENVEYIPFNKQTQKI